jgi:hypothetical protein
MSVITARRTIRSAPKKKAKSHRSIREMTRGYFTHERPWHFALELLFFAVIVAISAWPLLVAARALSDFLQRTPI